VSTSASVGVEACRVSPVRVACGLAPDFSLGFSLGLCDHLEACRCGCVFVCVGVCVCCVRALATRSRR